ncbi:MAG: archaeal proteasome endopeptidase complex subunit beta [Candidatus Nanoarchaeia archaeon]
MSTAVEAKKGTTTVGLICKDAVVLAADKRASMGYFISNKDVDKILKISDFVAMTIAGNVADAQMLARFLKAEMDLYRLNTGIEPTVGVASSLMQNILFSQGKSFLPYIVQLILAGIDEGGEFALYTLDPLGSNIKEKKYFATGSGSPMSFGLIEDAYKEGMSEEEGIQLAVRAVAAAIKRDMASGEAIDVVVINKKGFKRLEKIPAEVQIKLKK